jgi:hypothetical protein
MNNLSTTDLLNEINNMKDAGEFKNFVSSHPSDEASKDLKSYFNSYFSDKPDLDIPDIIRRSNLDRGYAYQIFNGRKQHPGKYKLVMLCLCAGMNFREIQRALAISGNSSLYVKNPQDAAFIVCINQGFSSMLEVSDFFEKNDIPFPL